MRRLGVAVTLVVLLAGCGSAAAARPAAIPRVVTRSVHLARGATRPLETTVWLPPVLQGRMPIVVFSHGLGGLPSQFAPIAQTWADAGFVVIAPAYPHTNGKVKIDSADVRNQPADAEYVLRTLTSSGDLAEHLDSSRVLAVGFSAGGTTTLGLLHRGHLPGLRAAVSVAGRRPSSAFGGSAVPVLFLHGDQDPTVPIAAGKQAYGALPWPKQFVTIAGGHHGDYLNPGNPDYPRVSAMIGDFLQGHAHGG